VIPNYTSKNGARAHGKAIADYWRERGATVNFEVVKNKAILSGAVSTVWSVKTDMVGGLPVFWIKSDG
tara:strand:+ start:778 stop:981 length:204 start_codon:yes stop_codon:yes gene_type:complete